MSKNPRKPSTLDLSQHQQPPHLIGASRPSPRVDVDQPTDYRKRPIVVLANNSSPDPIPSSASSSSGTAQQQQQLELGLPEFKTFVEGFQQQQQHSSNGDQALDSWAMATAVAASARSGGPPDDLVLAVAQTLLNSPVSDDGATTGGIGDDDMDPFRSDIFGIDPMFQESPGGYAWGLSKLLSNDIDDDAAQYGQINSTEEAEGRRKIELICSRLDIGSDPRQWTQSEVRKWLRYTLHQFNIPSTTNGDDDDWLFNGAHMCQLSCQDLDSRFPGDGGVIMAELEQWKRLGPLVSAAGHVGYSQPSSSTYATSHHYVVGGGSSGLPLQLTAIDAGPYLSQYTTLESAAGLEPSLSGLHGNGHHHADVNNNTFGGYLLSHPSAQRRLEPSLAVSALSRYPGTSVWDGSLTLNGDAPYIKTELMSQSSTADDSPSAESWLYPTPTETEPKRSLGTCKWNGQPTMTSHNMTDFRPSRGRGGNKRTICLWQFLRELLLNPQSHENWIRWVDRNRGIFKIEDSVRVAKLWGERKNRPQMNYDKLSRSIRQYYKKGIIQKTTNSKRLVYQFCPAYMV